MTTRRWLLVGLGTALAIVLAANAHLLYVSLASAPGCAEPSHATSADGETRVLAAAKAQC